MIMNRKKNRMRMINMIVDLVHVGICIAIIALAVLVFLNPMKSARFYPIVFFLASILNFTSAYAKMTQFRPSSRGRFVPGIGVLLFGIFFLILAVISAVSIWR